jgi:hypothetical protein
MSRYDGNIIVVGVVGVRCVWLVSCHAHVGLSSARSSRASGIGHE